MLEKEITNRQSSAIQITTNAGESSKIVMSTGSHAVQHEAQVVVRQEVAGEHHAVGFRGQKDSFREKDLIIANHTDLRHTQSSKLKNLMSQIRSSQLSLKGAVPEAGVHHKYRSVRAPHRTLVVTNN